MNWAQTAQDSGKVSVLSITAALQLFVFVNALEPSACDLVLKNFLHPTDSGILV